MEGQVGKTVHQTGSLVSFWFGKKNVKPSCSEWRGIAPIVSATRNVGRFGATLCGFARTRWHGCAAKHSVMPRPSLWRDCSWSLLSQAHCKKLREKVVFQHSATFARCGIAEARGCKSNSAGCARRIELNWVAEVTGEVAGRRFRAEVSSPDKRLLREEVAERRGTSARRLLSEEVAQKRSSLLTHPPTHPPTHPSIHPSIHPIIQTFTHPSIRPSIHPSIHSCVHGNVSLIHGFMDSLILWFIESLVHWFIDSLLQQFIVSLLHCFNDSLITTEIHSFIGSLNHPFIGASVD